MPQTDIELLLKKRMGLDAASIGSSCIGRAVSQRMAACGVEKAEEYAGLVAGSEEEFSQKKPPGRRLSRRQPAV